VHAAETPVEVLTGEYLPWLLQTAGAISADWAACQRVSQVTTPICRTGVRQADREPLLHGRAELTEPAPPGVVTISTVDTGPRGN
jgi:hypothetical protein